MKANCKPGRLRYKLTQNADATMSIKSNIAALLLLAYSPLGWCGDIAGLWQEYDDDTGKLSALIRIEMLSDGSYEGIIEKVFPITGNNAELRCIHCTGELHNLPLLGLRILSDIKRRDRLNFEDGKILDPDDGKIYRCNLQLSEDGNTLKVRGYLNVILVGQSETWLRANNPGY